MKEAFENNINDINNQSEKIEPNPTIPIKNDHHFNTIPPEKRENYFEQVEANCSEFYSTIYKRCSDRQKEYFTDIKRILEKGILEKKPLTEIIEKMPDKYKSDEKIMSLILDIASVVVVEDEQLIDEKKIAEELSEEERENGMPDYYG